MGGYAEGNRVRCADCSEIPQSTSVVLSDVSLLAGLLSSMFLVTEERLGNLIMIVSEPADKTEQSLFLLPQRAAIASHSSGRHLRAGFQLLIWRIFELLCHA